MKREHKYIYDTEITFKCEKLTCIVKLPILFQWVPVK